MAPQGPGGGGAIRCSICGPTRLRGSRGRIWGFPDEKGSNIDHLGVIWVPKMGFLRSEGGTSGAPQMRNIRILIIWESFWSAKWGS